jgi:hypothetical protein
MSFCSGCSNNESIPINEKISSIIIIDTQLQKVISEITDSKDIVKFMILLNQSKKGGISEPERPGKSYTLIIKGNNEYKINYLKSTESYLDDKIYFDDSKGNAWIPDKDFNTFFN